MLRSTAAYLTALAHVRAAEEATCVLVALSAGRKRAEVAAFSSEDFENLSGASDDRAFIFTHG